MSYRNHAAFLLLLALAGAAVAQDLKPALSSITTEGILKHIRVLASDEYEGRGPGTKGEELSVTYVADQFQKLGLKPGNPDGTFFQKAPLMGFKAAPTASFVAGKQEIPLKFPGDYVAVSRRYQPEVKVAGSEIVFVGYGVVAPEYGWDDYKGLDVRGKTLLMLINDPPVPDPKDGTKLDGNMFKGKAMTYYGRWTYKYEVATEKGAAAAIIIHETEPAAYPYEVVVGSWGRENFDIQRPDGNSGRVGVESWISLDTAKKLLATVHKDYDDMKKAAVRKDFKPVPLGVQANFTIKNTLRQIASRNVVAKLEGSDPKLKDEYVVFSAHWDHLGKDDDARKDPNAKVDVIYNGAHDNASGTAGLIEMAKAFKQLPVPPKRSILFVAVTAEEKGLLGAKYFAENPLYPLAKLVGNINMDGLNTWGRTKDFVVVGMGNSTLEDVLKQEAAKQNRVIVPDPEPEKGSYYRSDHFEFAKQGVPALDSGAGIDYVGKPAGYGKQKRDEFTAKDYHKVSDEIKPDWDLSGAVEDVQLLFNVGYRVAQDPVMPTWYPGTEFKAKRDATLKK